MPEENSSAPQAVIDTGFKPDQENLLTHDSEKKIYWYCDISGKPVHKSKEIYEGKKQVISYPYFVRRSTGAITRPKIKVIEFKGFKDSEIPNDFRKGSRYMVASTRLKAFMSFLNPKFKELEKLIIGINVQNRFSKKTVTLNWSDIEPILKELQREKGWHDNSRKTLINNMLSELSTKFEKHNKHLNSGELDRFLGRYDSFEKVSPKDSDALARVLQEIPPSRITSTSHFIEAKEKINTVFFENIIKEYERLIGEKQDNEEKWQKFFTNNAWILSHLFPFEVVLYKDKSYVGGKTLENDEGRVVDFLFQNGIKDNFALLEIKTHTKPLLSKTPYREPSVFSVSAELSGGINQCLDQKDIFIKENGKKHKMLDPMSILVIGQKKDLSDEQAGCFELLRANQKNVLIVTFDELLEKLKGLYRVITRKKK